MITSVQKCVPCLADTPPFRHRDLYSPRIHLDGEGGLGGLGPQALVAYQPGSKYWAWSHIFQGPSRAIS